MTSKGGLTIHIETAISVKKLLTSELRHLLRSMTLMTGWPLSISRTRSAVINAWSDKDGSSTSIAACLMFARVIITSSVWYVLQCGLSQQHVAQKLGSRVTSCVCPSVYVELTCRTRPWLSSNVECMSSSVGWATYMSQDLGSRVTSSVCHPV